MPRCIARVALIGWIVLLLAGCSVPPLHPFTGGTAGTPTPAPPAVKETRTDTLFALRVGETARVADANLDVTFAGVMADERCPLNVECFVSGPVRLALQVGSTGGATATLDVDPDQLPQKVYLPLIAG